MPRRAPASSVRAASPARGRGLLLPASDGAELRLRGSHRARAAGPDHVEPRRPRRLADRPARFGRARRHAGPRDRHTLLPSGRQSPRADLRSGLPGLSPGSGRRDVVQGHPQARSDGKNGSAGAGGRADARDRVHRADGRVSLRARRPRRAALLGRKHGAARLLASVPAPRSRRGGSLAPLPRLGEEDSDRGRPGPSRRAAGANGASRRFVFDARPRGASAWSRRAASASTRP